MANVIVVAPSMEVWGNFKKACEANKLPYHSLKMKKFPIIWNEFIIYKKKVQ